jgi:hypothetical protein
MAMFGGWGKFCFAIAVGHIFVFQYFEIVEVLKVVPEPKVALSLPKC